MCLHFSHIADYVYYFVLSLTQPLDLLIVCNVEHLSVLVCGHKCVLCLFDVCTRCRLHALEGVLDETMLTPERG